METSLILPLLLLLLWPIDIVSSTIDLRTDASSSERRRASLLSFSLTRGFSSSPKNLPGYHAFFFFLSALELSLLLSLLLLLLLLLLLPRELLLVLLLLLVLERIAFFPVAVFIDAITASSTFTPGVYSSSWSTPLLVAAKSVALCRLCR